MKANQLLKSSLTHFLLGLLASGALLATAPSANATVVNFGMGADDYGTLSINGVLLCTYDNISAAGGCNSSFNMQPGVWYDIAIDYKNRAGSDGMALSWDQPGPASIGYGFSGSFPGLVPKANFRTLDAGGTNYVSGLRGDYYDLSGNLQSTVFGEGPIDAINDVYNNVVVGSWNGYGYFSLFEERLSGQIRLACGDDRDAIIDEYATFGVNLSPTCGNFTQTAHTVYFTFAELNTGDYTWALLRQPLMAAAATGYGLDKWREEFGGLRIINSAYRNPARNASVGGAQQSRHMYGDAADLRNVSGNHNEYKAMRAAARRAQADYIEPPSGPCGTACAHADWRSHPGPYVQ